MDTFMQLFGGAFALLAALGAVAITIVGTFPDL
jgi:hypothetical protein